MSVKPSAADELAASASSIKDATEEWHDDNGNSPSLSKDSSTETYTDLTSTDPLQFLPLVAAGEGPVYVMVTSAQEMVTPHSHVRKRASSSSEGNSNGAGRCPRDEKRRATHNEVERRRRDKINNWICKLARIVPDVASDRTKQGQSKGGILAKACDYINDLVKENDRLSDVIKENEILGNELDKLRLQLLEVKNENRRLKNLLHRNGIQNEDD